jgi:hypothetical protein
VCRVCACVCVFCALVFTSSFFIRFALWCISKKNFETGTRGKSTKLLIKIPPHPPAINKCRKYSTAKNTTTMSTSTGTLSFFFARTCDRNWDYTVASTRKTRRDEKIFFDSAYSLFSCCWRSRDDLKISNAKKEFTCSHHHCGTRKKAKRENEREKFEFFEAFFLRVVARVSRRMREYRFLFKVSV